MCRHQEAACRATEFLLKKCNLSPWKNIVREIMTAKNDSFFKKYRAIRKKISENSQKVVSTSSTEGIGVWTSFSGRNGNFRGFSVKNSNFGHFRGIFRVKNSIFTIFRWKTVNGIRYHRIRFTLGILKRYHIFSNSQNFSF